jgi:hypothetical protein
MTICPSTVVTVPDYKNLLAAWREYGHTGLVGRFVVNKPPTPAQLRRLSAKLRDILEYPRRG